MSVVSNNVKVTREDTWYFEDVVVTANDKVYGSDMRSEWTRLEEKIIEIEKGLGTWEARITEGRNRYVDIWNHWELR